jgi:hypothetical protein
MLKTSLLTLSSALCLTGAFTAQAGSPKKNPPPPPPPIAISSLPFVISAPGTYALTGNLSSSDSTNAAAIRIQTDIPGPVTVDLKGFTLTGGGGSSVGVGIGGFAGTNVSNSFPITIRNGTITNFGFGVWAECGQGISLSQITIYKLNINTAVQGQDGIFFEMVFSSTINSCSISGGNYGIEDSQSPGGNSYVNDTFKNTNPLVVTSQNGGLPTVLSNCSFNAPTN